MKTMRLYLAGGMRGYPLHNFPLFDKVAAELRNQGHYVISPAELDRDIGFDPATEVLPDGFVEQALRRDVAALLDVDAIALLPGWRCSAGACFEHDVATRIGLADYEVHEGAYGIELRPVEKAHALIDKETDEDKARAAFNRDAFAYAYREGLDIEVGEFKRNPFACRAEAPPSFLNEVAEAATWIEGQWRQLEETDEVRVTSPTGGQKGSKPQKIGQIPPRFLLALGEVYGRGNEKYPDADTGRPNWSRGYSWELSYNALHRHLAAFWAGEYDDPDDGLPHLIHAAWHAATLYTFHEEGLGTDDRPAYYRTEVAS